MPPRRAGCDTSRSHTGSRNHSADQHNAHRGRPVPAVGCTRPHRRPLHRVREDAIDADASSKLLADWLTAWQPEAPATAAARARAAEVGVGCVDEAGGAALRLLAAVAGARAVVELGTGAGVSSLWLLAGMAPEGVLTSVDSDGEHQRLARLGLAEAGVPAARARLITGRALEVLPRLTDGAYDLVFADAARSENVDYLRAGLRLLRPGGVIVFAGALAGGRIAQPSARDADTVGLRDLAKTVREDERLVPAMLPTGSGLLAAVLRPGTGPEPAAPDA